MNQKPKIQYVGQFYVHGSEAKKLELQQQRTARFRQPIEKLQQIERIYVDPVALVGIVVAVVMLVTMVMGALQIRRDWEEYNAVSSYVSWLKEQKAEKQIDYRKAYDLEDIATKAHALGLVPKSEVKTMTVTVVVPEPEPEVSRIEEIKGFLEDMFA